MAAPDPPMTAPRRATPPRLLLLLAAGLAAAGCRELRELGRALDPSSPYEQYAHALQRAGLGTTAAGRDWLEAGEQALERPVSIAPPVRISGYLAPAEPAALGYRLELRRGQRVLVDAGVESAEPMQLFVDLFEIPEDGGEAPRRRASADSGTSRLDYEVRRDGPHLLRLQPELLRGGRITLTVRTTASLAFPVPGFDGRAVRSRFGAERDAGRRRHEGVDIFAPRGTPVVAATGGLVTGVGTNRLGGLVVWLLDLEREQRLYYAHLDTQLVRAGQRVRPGAVLGLVGNTGNARTTPPHLHFGIYAMGEGAVDPFPFLDRPEGEPDSLAASPAAIGTFVRAAGSRARLRLAPDEEAELVGVVPRHTVLEVRAATGDWYQVTMPDGTGGFLRARDAEGLSEPVRIVRLPRPRPVLDRPGPGGVAMDSLGSGARVAVLAGFGDFLYVRTGDGREGWLPEEEPTAVLGARRAPAPAGRGATAP